MMKLVLSFSFLSTHKFYIFKSETVEDTMVVDGVGVEEAGEEIVILTIECSRVFV
jgi:hypothetical protein